MATALDPGNNPGPSALTWTAVDDTTFGDDINGIAYGGGKFVAVGYEGKAAYSADGGATWNPVDDTKFIGYIKGIAYGGPAGKEKFVAVGSSGKAVYCTTPDGTWTAVTDTGFDTTDDINAIAYGGGKFVVVGNKGKAAYSNKQE
jgi:hypothetical protein